MSAANHWGRGVDILIHMMHPKTRQIMSLVNQQPKRVNSENLKLKLKPKRGETIRYQFSIERESHQNLPRACECTQKGKKW